MKKGKAEGLDISITALIKFSKKLNIPKEDIITQISEDFDLSKEEAEERVKSAW